MAVLRVLSIALLLLSACEKAPREHARCLDRAALIGGESGPDYLGLGAATRRAIVSVEIVTAEGEILPPCSGAIVAERWVLTAAHCTSGKPSRAARVHVGTESSCAEATLHTERLVAHPTLDLLALELVQAVGELPVEIAPLALATRAPPHVEPGALVVLAGFGLDEQGAHGVRKLLVETIVDVSPSAWTVVGAGPRGACGGDSGGPLLHRDAVTGAPLLLGVLSEGDPSCRGRDTYTRVDAARSWLQELGLDGAARAGAPCEEIDAVGRCLGRLGVYCEAGVLHSEPCLRDARCAYDGAAGRFACLGDADESPCGDVDQAGRCERGAATWCELGERRVNSCAAATSSACVRGAATGKVACVPDGEGR